MSGTECPQMEYLAHTTLPGWSLKDDDQTEAQTATESLVCRRFGLAVTVASKRTVMGARCPPRPLRHAGAERRAAGRFRAAKFTVLGPGSKISFAHRALSRRPDRHRAARSHYPQVVEVKRLPNRAAIRRRTRSGSIRRCAAQLSDVVKP